MVAENVQRVVHPCLIDQAAHSYRKEIDLDEGCQTGMAPRTGRRRDRRRHNRIL